MAHDDDDVAHADDVAFPAMAPEDVACTDDVASADVAWSDDDVACDDVAWTDDDVACAVDDDVSGAGWSSRC